MLLLKAMFLISYGLNAQVITEGWDLESIHGPSQLGIVESIPLDINKDGLMDVVSVSILDGHLRAYINQGGLIFEQQHISQEVPGAYRVSATDLNSDGEIDFLIPSIETNEIIGIIYQSGGYQKQIIAKGVLLPTDALSADFNNDGLSDVVSLSYEENLVLIHLQNQSGEFKTTVIAQQVNKPRKMEVSDFNNDGLIDFVVVSSGDNSVRLYQNQGAAEFTEILISDKMIGTKFITICDVHDEEYSDFVVSASDVNTVYLFSNIGAGKFAPIMVDDDLPGVNELHCADIDNDQQLELITNSVSTGSIHTHEMSGSLNKKLITNVRDGYVSISSAKFENSNQVKILTQAHFENRNLLYEPAQFHQESVIWEDFPDGANSVVLSDINSDDIKDLVVASFRDDRVQWYDGITGKHHIIAEQIDGATEVISVDLDEDGNMDVLSAASIANTFYWHRNKGGEVFENIVIYDSASFATGLDVGDINGDLQLDVIGVSSSDHSVRWFNRSGKKFTEHIIDNQNAGPIDIQTADIDVDGNLDVVVANYFSHDVFVYYNDGLGSFTASKIAAGINKAYSLVLKDLSQDGLLDVIVSSTGHGAVFKLINHAVGSFTATSLIENLNTPKKIISNNAIDNHYLLVNSLFENKDIISVFTLSGVSNSDSPASKLFFFANFYYKTSQIYLVTLDDLIFQNHFDN